MSVYRYETDLVSWELTDPYGWPLSLTNTSKSVMREIRLDGLLNEEGEYNDCLYTASLEGNEFVYGKGYYKISWEKKTKLLSLWTIGTDDKELRIKLKAETIYDCDSLVKLIMESNDLKLMPVCIPKNKLNETLR
jgi:hypothetical protein